MVTSVDQVFIGRPGLLNGDIVIKVALLICIQRVGVRFPVSPPFFAHIDQW